jgi:hypothetical protein
MSGMEALTGTVASYQMRATVLEAKFATLYQETRPVWKSI